jgi:hypothetical protein
MLKKYLPLIAFVSIAVSCNKDKLETKPSIKIKSINGTEFTPSQPTIITLEFADKEGDLSSGILKYYRNRLNVYYPVTQPLEDSVISVLPEFPKSQRGEFQLTIDGGRMNENPDHNDTTSWKIVVIDQAGNASDTIETPPLVEIND